MKDYSTDAPVFSDSINIVEPTDLVNDENNNAAPKQLLQNDLVLKVLIEALTQKLNDNVVAAKDYTDTNYQQSTAYTDQKIADLINGAPSTLDTLKEIADAMGENESVVKALEVAIGTKASQAEMESLLALKLEKTGDAKDNIVSFTSNDTSTPSGWKDIALFKTKETFTSLLGKITTMASNLRWFYKMLGTTDISAIGGGTLTGAISELNGKLGDIRYGTLTFMRAQSGGMLTASVTFDKPIKSIVATRHRVNDNFNYTYGPTDIVLTNSLVGECSADFRIYPTKEVNGNISFGSEVTSVEAYYIAIVGD